MSYLICNMCEIYYEINSDFDFNTLKTCEKCNRELKYYSNFDEYYTEKNSGIKKENAFKSLILMITDVFIRLYSKKNRDIKEANTINENKIKSIRKENSTTNYFKKLPEGHFILNNLRIQDRKLKIDHVVIGPIGIFLIHLKNSNGHYIINDNEWLNDKGKITGNMLENPQQVKLNAIEFKRFLDSKNLNIDYLLINSIVAFSNRNFTVRKMPRAYNVMRVEEISNFITNSKTKMDMGTITEAVLLLEPYCGGVTRS